MYGRRRRWVCMDEASSSAPGANQAPDTVGGTPVHPSAPRLLRAFQACARPCQSTFELPTTPKATAPGSSLSPRSSSAAAKRVPQQHQGQTCEPPELASGVADQATRRRVDWRFTAADARIKTPSLPYPQFRGGPEIVRPAVPQGWEECVSQPAPGCSPQGTRPLLAGWRLAGCPKPGVKVSQTTGVN